MSGQAAPRVAALDIGTNSVLLTVAEVGPGGSLSVIAERATVTRLGQGVDQTGVLAPDAIQRTLQCLSLFREDLEHYQVVRSHAVGTSALRDARGGADFIEQAALILGFSPEIISGQREAELTFSGALSGLALTGPTFVFDIGGGSTELIMGQTPSKTGLSKTIEQAASLNIGSVRLTERCRVQDPPTEENARALRQEVSQALAESNIRVPQGALVVGVAGTVTTLAAIAEEMRTYDPDVVHGYRLARSVVSTLVDKLSRMTVAERSELPGLTPGRADVIFAGAILCEEILHYAQASELTVSDRGVRFGLLAELATP